MYENALIKQLALARTRDDFSNSPQFLSLDLADQKRLYEEAYRRNYDDIAAGQTPKSMSRVPSRAMAGGGASEMIDDSRHTNQRIDQAGELAGDFIDQVDFPGFVKDLLKGVFDANLHVTLEQMKAYQTLLKTATESISKFVNAIDDTAAFGYLAENNGDEFNIDFSDMDTNDDGSKKVILTDKEGNPADLGDNQVKAKIMDAKIAMAKEQRALLRETILMGITRLVVEKGNVKASVIFDIKAGERIQKNDKAALKEATSSGGSISAGGGLIGSIFGGPRGGYTSSNRKTKISVSTAASQSATDLAAKIAGSVDITFKSDYFKLDNFAQMYGPQAGSGAGGTAATPAAPGAAAPPVRTG
jgi:hypothetical protein